MASGGLGGSLGAQKPRTVLWFGTAQRTRVLETMDQKWGFLPPQNPQRVCTRAGQLSHRKRS